MLHIFAVNEATEVRHTFLSRSKGEAATLPDLAGWLSLRKGGLNTDEIELFPVSDLSGLTLADYVQTAFDPGSEALASVRPRLNALEGHVLLAPEAALAGDWKAGRQVTLVASLPLPQADHSSQALAPAQLDTEPPARSQDMLEPPRKSQVVPAMIFAFVLAVILFTVSNFW